MTRRGRVLLAVTTRLLLVGFGLAWSAFRCVAGETAAGLLLEALVVVESTLARALLVPCLASDSAVELIGLLLETLAEMPWIPIAARLAASFFLAMALLMNDTGTTLGPVMRAGRQGLTGTEAASAETLPRSQLMAGAAAP